jgi:hypothetical protein
VGICRPGPAPLRRDKIQYSEPLNATTGGEMERLSLESEGSPAPLLRGLGDDGEEDAATTRRINLKTDLALLPGLSLLYLFNGLDRGNIGNAQTQGDVTDRENRVESQLT